MSGIFPALAFATLILAFVLSLPKLARADHAFWETKNPTGIGSYIAAYVLTHGTVLTAVVLGSIVFDPYLP